jgi:LmbE family N-acetylglucosaminyl deacetylase
LKKFEHYKKVLVLSPHTDDAELGCGATIARLIEEGKEVFIAVFSTCDESLPDALPAGTLVQEFNHSCDASGIKAQNRIINNYPVRRLLEYRQEVLESLVKLRNSLNPDLVILPSEYDVHQDHQVIHIEGIRAFLKTSSIWAYELPWNHRTFSPNHFVRISEQHLEKKIQMLSCYKSQLILNRKYFSKEFIKGLACVRGVQSSCDYSEAFEIIRQNY